MLLCAANFKPPLPTFRCALTPNNRRDMNSHYELLIRLALFRTQSSVALWAFQWATIFESTLCLEPTRTLSVKMLINWWPINGAIKSASRILLRLERKSHRELQVIRGDTKTQCAVNQLSWRIVFSNLSELFPSISWALWFKPSSVRNCSDPRMEINHRGWWRPSKIFEHYPTWVNHFTKMIF